MDKLLLGTNNPGKVRELKALLAPVDIKVLTPDQVAVSLKVAETGVDYEANARKKALAFAEASGRWTLADDSGLEVAVLDGAPGLQSARLAGPAATDADRIRQLLDMLAQHSRPWKALFRCTMALASPEMVHHVTIGVCRGEIIPEERGQGGFGYDPIFVVAGTGKTMAELGVEEKNRLSHRARAVEKMLPILLELKEEGPAGDLSLPS
ncbi:MAG: RdgB/HAM1 family non-canonical purine NTP pyrophosphatase [Anaerolineales bacterium]